MESKPRYFLLECFCRESFLPLFRRALPSLAVFPSAPLLQLIFISLLAHSALAGARVTTSLYALSLHASEFTIGTLIALFALFPMLLAVSAGRAIDRIGIVRPMLAGCAAIAAGCALPGFVSGLPVLYLATILIGTGFMVVQVAAQHTVGAISAAERRASNFSWLALGFSISGFCGPVMAGFLIDHARHDVAYLAFCMIALSALSLTACGRLRQVRPAAQEKEACAGGAMQLLRDRELRRIYIVGTLLASAWDLFTFVLPIHGAHLGFSASTIGIILGSFSAATFLVRLGMPWIARHYSEWHVLTAALILAVVCYALFPLTGRPASMMAVAAMLGAAVGSSQPNMLALLHHAAPSGRGAEAVGVRITIGNACQVILPLAFGGAGAALGLPAVFWAMSAMIGAGVPAAWHQAFRK
ncbi:MFS transporter [Noviherbaspirillum sp. UKPF54]|nr:MFS transporter [Noviherbaspirillum sp. UKPF54]